MNQDVNIPGKTWGLTLGILILKLNGIEESSAQDLRS